MLRQSLVQFDTKDKLTLPGLLYEPAHKTKKVALFLHGNGSSSIFYTANFNETIANELAKKGMAYFPFNNRGAHLIKKFSRRVKGKKVSVRYGMTYELIKECPLDIDAAIRFLKRRGYNEFFLIGHSTGANKICVYDHYRPKNPISKYVLLAGADDMGLYYKELGKEWFRRLLFISKRKTKQGKGRELLKERELRNIISYQSLYDTINPDGDYNSFPFLEYFSGVKLSKKKLFRQYARINTPTLVVHGEKDEYLIDSAQKTMECLRTFTKHPEKFSFKIIKGADHGFRRHDKELGRVLAIFLAK